MEAEDVLNAVLGESRLTEAVMAGLKRNGYSIVRTHEPEPEPDDWYDDDYRGYDRADLLFGGNW